MMRSNNGMYPTRFSVPLIARLGASEVVSGRVKPGVRFLSLVGAAMGRIEWLKWVMRYGNPKTRWRNIRGFLAFEFYSLGCALSGYPITHWLEERSPRPAGRYVRVVRPAPPAVRALDKVFSFGEEAHSEYVPYTPGFEEDVRRAGGRAKVVEISYRIGMDASE